MCYNLYFKKKDTRVLAHLNIVGVGMRSRAIWEQALADMDPQMTALTAMEYSEYIRGIIFLSSNHYKKAKLELRFSLGEEPRFAIFIIIP